MVSSSKCWVYHADSSQCRCWTQFAAAAKSIAGSQIDKCKRDAKGEVDGFWTQILGSIFLEVTYLREKTLRNDRR